MPSRHAVTPRNTKSLSSSSLFCLPSAGQFDRQSFGLESTKRDSLQSDEAATVQLLELKNTELRRKLSKSRAKSREKLDNIAHDRQQLNAENAMLRQECETLRNLFIRQQQQQIAFWAGPFMEMVLPKGSNQSAPSELLLGQLTQAVSSACADLAPIDVNGTSETMDASAQRLDFQKKPFPTEDVAPKEMPTFLTAEQRLIQSLPTPLSAKRNLMNSLETSPRSQKTPPCANGTTNANSPLESSVAQLDLCGAASRQKADLKSVASSSLSDSSDSLLHDSCFSDTSDESIRSAFV